MSSDTTKTFKLNNIAVLIDADNASSHNIDVILSHIATLGHIDCKRIYGDWGNPHIQGWREKILTHVIEPMQQFAYVTGKNTTDIGLVIDAMDLLYSGDYDGFCLVSSDSDFTALALRIRKNHVKVIGFGRHMTVQAFTNACDDFYYVEALAPSMPVNANINESSLNLSPILDNRSTQKFIIKNSIIDNTIVENKTDKNSTIENSTLIQPTTQKTVTHSSKVIAPTAASPIIKSWHTTPLNTRNKLITTINTLIKNNPNSQQGYTNLSYIASELKQKHQDVQWQCYGHKKFSDFLKAIGQYEMRQMNNATMIKVKKTTTAPKKTATSTVEKSSIPWTEKQLKCDTKLLNSLRAAINDNPKVEAERWVHFSAVHQALKADFPDFNPQYYGYTKVPSIIKKIGLFETKTVNSALYIRQK